MRLYDNKYLSVTSIIELREPFDRESFSKWCIKNGKNEKLISATSRLLGEKVSDYLDNYHNGLEAITKPPVDMLESRLLGGVDKFLKDWKLIETEKKVVCESLNYAGRLDGLVEDKDGKRLLVDWKTFGAWKDGKYKKDSKKIKHTAWQLTMYANALAWKDGIAVVVFTNEGDFVIEKVEYDNDMIKWIEDNQKLILKTIEDAQEKDKV